MSVQSEPVRKGWRQGLHWRLHRGLRRRSGHEPLRRPPVGHEVGYGAGSGGGIGYGIGYGGSPKRALDLTLVLLAALPALLLIAALALLVAGQGAGQGGRPFYRQLRVGRDGRAFWMWKLRTMRPDAEAALAALLAADPEARAEWAQSQKLRTDPRITRLGRLLRKTSLDELPQIWNVARGEMSLVGPRPMLPEQRPLYPGEAYFRLRPGITGLWQVSERNRTSFAERAEFDTRYAESLSLGTDLGIFLRTVQVVLKGTGC